MGLGYKETFLKSSTSSTIEKGYGKKAYDTIAKGFVEKERRFPVEQKVEYQQEGSWRIVSQIMFPTLRYQNIFLGVCYSCGNFEHKAINCEAYGRNKMDIGSSFKNNYLGKSHNDYMKKYNIFGYLIIEV